MEVSEVRRRLRGAIESARKQAQERRGRSDRAAQEYELFLHDHAVPMFHTIASALVAEGHRFKVFTPAGAVRLASETSGDDYIELTLDTTNDPPAVMARINRGRGRRVVTEERPVKEGTEILDLTGEDVLNLVAEAILPFVER